MEVRSRSPWLVVGAGPLACVCLLLTACGGTPAPGKSKAQPDAGVVLVVDGGSPDQPPADRPGGPPSDGGRAADGPAVAMDVAPRPVLVPPPAPASPPAADCSGVVGAVLTRSAEHVAAGYESTVRLLMADGIPPAASRDLRSCVKVQNDKGDAVPVLVAKRPLVPGFTALLVDPGRTAEENRVARDAVAAFLDGRPPTEAVALFRWGSDVTQVVTTLTDRDLLLSRMASGMPPLVAGNRAGIETAMEHVAADMQAVGGVSRDVMRSMVVISPRALDVPSAAALQIAYPLLVLWLAPGAGSLNSPSIPPGLRFNLNSSLAQPDGGVHAPDGGIRALDAGGALDAGSTAADGVAGLSQRLDDYLSRGHYVLAQCGTGAALEAQIRAGSDKVGVTWRIPASLPENLGGQCDWSSLVDGKHPYTRKISLVLTPQARTTSRTMDAFPVQIQLSPDHLPVEATAHRRGKGSFSCKRGNYKVTLPGKRPRFIIPGGAMNEFFLISMCLDPYYDRNLTMDQLLASEGMFPGPFQMVELVMDGQSQGVYLVTQDPHNWMRENHVGTAAVVRRDVTDNGQMTYPEVDWSDLTDDQALAGYNTILNSLGDLSGQALEDALRTHLDLDSYLRWLAVVNVMGSGDYVDEIFFQSTNATDPTGATSQLNLVYPWDSEDIFETCHFNGQFALRDPRGLLTCTESELDKRMFGDEQMLNRYREILDATLNRFTHERVEAVINKTLDTLYSYFANPATLAAMSELGKTTPAAVASLAGAKATIGGHAADLLAQFDAHRIELKARIAFSRANPGVPYPIDAGATDGSVGGDGGVTDAAPGN